ncbi:MAG: DUF192 domain-containing protein [Roseovarius sp.]|nr:DUF192 domain-containing protein [Roseovarius sp.]MCY4207863.1 DUF192 domain-containing protein [Roseovarius sp.]MCY4316754.1 DUF192 domain-containing protein [Roseovarius sp.]
MGIGKFTTKVGLSPLISVFLLGAALAECKSDSINLRGDWGQARFTVEVADTEQEHSVGLMGRTSLPMSSGMLFTYEHPRSVSFWMANTYIPLDMLFADETGVVRNINHDAAPLNRAPFFGGEDIKYVLEINGGLARKLGIDVGTEMQHLAINTEVAIWPCE